MLTIKRFMLAALLLGVLGAGLPIASSPDASTADNQTQIAVAPNGDFDVRPNGWPDPVD